ncbi:tail completion protein gp17 [Alkaliphilus peptidifermentans]|uniref:Uncharacterized protein n=1 Tax=Alkaliphilus peptidifermentans DSM 18978 TaxID=1120976 RepID=A0A1G5EEU2_9FIRM|nr:DUF3168 domain-containing protein [Alkaliphilus peptidifermentans]SCY25230.1 Protein of unknown function [Alkaliphilus peptidifermentans DSM 18978]
MELGEALFQYLSNHSDLKEKIGDRIYPIMMPQNAKLPVIIYSQISTRRSHALQKDTGFVSQTIQFSCHGKSYKEAVALSKTLRKILQNFSGTMGDLTIQGVLLIGEVTLSQGTTTNYRTDQFIISTDYEFQYIED